MPKTAFAIAAHPDDIEFMMSGTLMLLGAAGYELHYMNIANGNLGTTQYDTETIVAMRRSEAMEAAASIGALVRPVLDYISPRSESYIYECTGYFATTFSTPQSA